MLLELSMPFHPKELSAITLRDLAKNLKRGAPDSLGHPITLTQAQALLAHTLGYPRWSALIASAHSGASPQAQLEKFAQDLEKQFEQMMVKQGWSFYVNGDENDVFTAEELSAVDGLLSFWLVLAFEGKDMPGEVRFSVDPTSLAGFSLQPVSLPQQGWESLKKAVMKTALAMGNDPNSRDLEVQLTPVMVKFAQANGYYR